jgi:hypothetical protein
MALYLDCTTADLAAESLFRLVVVDSDGDAYFDCDNTELSWEDIWRQLIVVDGDGNPALAVYGVGAGGGGYQDFTTTAGQTVFTVTDITLGAMYKVFVDGIYQSWGHTRVGNVVTFGIAFAAGHEVSIQM